MPLSPSVFIVFMQVLLYLEVVDHCKLFTSLGREPVEELLLVVTQPRYVIDGCRFHFLVYWVSFGMSLSCFGTSVLLLRLL